MIGQIDVSLVKSLQRQISARANLASIVGKRLSNQRIPLVNFGDMPIRGGFMGLLELLFKSIKKDGCEGYYDNTPYGTEFDCDYEFSGDISCEDCMFGPCEGTKDPRINSKEELADD